MVSKVMFSSESTEWETPPEVFDPLHREFGFTLDVCATPGNAKCPNYFTPEADGLAQSWSGVCWMNPPYGRGPKGIIRWMKKAHWEACIMGATVVALVPARTDTQWWHEYVMKADEIRFLRGRITFVGAAHSAPFPSAIVVYGHRGRTPAMSGWSWR